MTLDDIKRRIKEIEAEAGDDERQHGAEDQLHQDVLQLIAKGKCPDPKRYAREALKTKDIDFCRWCA